MIYCASGVCAHYDIPCECVRVMCGHGSIAGYQTGDVEPWLAMSNSGETSSSFRGVLGQDGLLVAAENDGHIDLQS